MIELRRVSVRLGSTEALRNVSLSVEAGEWLALIGPNGAGKTTALRALCGLVRGTGDVLVDGRDVRTLGRRELARLAAFVPQIPETPPELTVAEYVLLGRTPYLGYFGAEGRADRLAAERALEPLTETHRLTLARGCAPPKTGRNPRRFAATIVGCAFSRPTSGTESIQSIMLIAP